MAEVTDADRELAASYAVLPEMRDLIRAGKAEHHAEPAAAHREAHEAPLKARIAELDKIASDLQLLCDQQAFKIAELEAENVQLREEVLEPSPYCEVCGSCGDEGCGCTHKCKYPIPDPADTFRIEELEAALTNIKAEMKFPNQLESGFVHGKPTYKDLFNRVSIAIAIARAALKGHTDE